MKKVKVGLIGLGEVAQVIHLPVLKAMEDRFEITALCDLSPGLLCSMGQKFRVNRLYSEAEALCRDEDVDAVFVLNSDEYHKDCTIAALKQNKHVLLEKPMCLNLADADEIIRARDASQAQVMIGYMRRFAPAFLQAVEEVKQMDRVVYARIRDIIGQNSYFVNQTGPVLRPDDIPEEASADRAKRAREQVREAIGDVSPDIERTYRKLCGLSSHDLSAMRELIGVPRRVVAATQWDNGNFINAIFEFDGFHATFETGNHNIGVFDAHIEVYSDTKSCKVQYDTPYIRHLPTTLEIQETRDEALDHRMIRPTFQDPYTLELGEFYKVVTKNAVPKTSPEDAREDLILFKQIIEALR